MSHNRILNDLFVFVYGPFDPMGSCRACLYNSEPLKPLLYSKLRFTEVYIIFLISAQKYILWVLIRTISPRQFFLSETFQFLEVKFSIYLKRFVFVMLQTNTCTKYSVIRKMSHTYQK